MPVLHILGASQILQVISASLSTISPVWIPEASSWQCHAEVMNTASFSMLTASLDCRISAVARVTLWTRVIYP